MYKSYLHLIIILFLGSILIGNDKLNFSAKNLENINNETENKRIFKNNVVMSKDSLLVYSDLATHYPDSLKVYLNGNVKMYDFNDSLFCNQLVLYDEELRHFIASGNVVFYRNSQIIKSEYLEYISLDNENDIRINIYDNGIIKDSLRVIKGDSIVVSYKDSTINDINIRKNAQIYNYRYAKIDSNASKQIFEDFLSSKKMKVKFKNGDAHFLELDEMAITKFNVIKDTLLQGLNNVLGDSISIIMEEQIIEKMYVHGNASGTFIPEKNNSSVESEIKYSANIINYLVDKEATYLNDNANVNYDNTILNAGEIYVDWEKNFLEAKIKDNIYPSVNGFGESPTFGEHLTYDFTTKRGKMIKGSTHYGQGNNQMYYKGKKIYRNSNHTYHIQNSLLTSCDREHPHYYFKSRQMKMIPNDRIIAKPMTLYLHDYPLVSIPFAVFPNKMGSRVSGWIMPSFGNRSTTGTYVDDLGYYYAPNDYLDYRFLIDIRDKGGIKYNNRLRYYQKSGKSWYQTIRGNVFFETDYKLEDEEKDILRLFNRGKNKKYNILRIKHNQKFNPYQNLNINYKHSNTVNYQSISLKERIRQTNFAHVAYSNSTERGTLSMGYNADQNLLISEPTDGTDYSIYKSYGGPSISYSLKHFSTIGGQNLFLNFSTFYTNGNKTYKKVACIDKDHDGECDCVGDNIENCDNDMNIDSCLDSNDDGECDICIEENGVCSNCIDDNEDGLCDENFGWSNDEYITENYGGLNNVLNVSTTFDLNSIAITPKVTMYYDIADQYYDLDSNGEENIYKDYIDRFSWQSSLMVKTAIYGMFPINIGNMDIVRHKITPSLNFSYIPNILDNYLDNQFYEIDGILKDKLSNTSVRGISSEKKYITLNVGNDFQAKIRNDDSTYSKINLFEYNFATTYNEAGIGGIEDRKFSDLTSNLIFKKPNGNKVFNVDFVHDMYDQRNRLLLEQGKSPKLKKIKFVLSHSFNLSGDSQSFNNTDSEYLSNNEENFNEISDSTNIAGNSSLLEMENFKPKLSGSKLWSTTFGFNINAQYEEENKEWDYHNLGLTANSSIHLTKNWLLTYATGVNLLDMQMYSQSIKLTRQLHCWEFMFTWWPDGYSKGFRLNINVINPDLQDIKVRSSSSNLEWGY